MTTIGPSVIITGELSTQEDITVHGRVEGHVTVREGALVVALEGAVNADVQCTVMTVHGKLCGGITSSVRVELAPTANVTGTLTTPSVVLRDGAVFNGLLETAPAGQAIGNAKRGPVASEPLTRAS